MSSHPLSKPCEDESTPGLFLGRGCFRCAQTSGRDRGRPLRQACPRCWVSVLYGSHREQGQTQAPTLHRRSDSTLAARTEPGRKQLRLTCQNKTHCGVFRPHCTYAFPDSQSGVTVIDRCAR
ncbi:hypothetical protein D2E71_16970 [Mycobacteroides abscessus]|nr:hypothetical protein B9M80_20225 [Mycobacteroides abscessus]RWU62728.1 hypothetical protein EPJ93_01530 [Mycobacteroides abscessus subsp. abscessus]RIR03847.1 hypothetical protein D2E35_05815 [Mycobacteroides abscessus]RIR40828.1 hypothetical protein D2E38_00925 [Mycobacteroides abscessus]RIR42394.1 hypothetical protein D2E36_09190 [Mycobacteroides abscessus]